MNALSCRVAAVVVFVVEEEIGTGNEGIDSTGWSREDRSFVVVTGRA
jgi:hypothetical protein